MRTGATIRVADSSPIRLSSRLSVAARLLYGGIYLGLVGLALRALIAPPRPTGPELGFTAAALLVALALGRSYLAIFAFRTVHLHDDALLVNGLRRTWRIPVRRIGRIVTTTPRGWTMVRVELHPPVDGIGHHLRVLGPFREPSEYVAELIAVAQRNPRVGA